jgi:hypothetical protein
MRLRLIRASMMEVARVAGEVTGGDGMDGDAITH